jgi:hypothetical protein
VSGRIIVDIMARGGRSVICFVLWKCHLILVLFDVGNIVSDVAYVRRM